MSSGSGLLRHFPAVPPTLQPQPQTKGSHWCKVAEGPDQQSGALALAQPCYWLPLDPFTSCLWAPASSCEKLEVGMPGGFPGSFLIQTFGASDLPLVPLQHSTIDKQMDVKKFPEIHREAHSLAILEVP